MFYASIVFEIFAYKYDFFVQLVQSILKYNRGIYMQNVLLRLREVQPSLSSTERQIAQFILENPDETTTLTIRDLARRSFSSPSSVVRICRVIGFQGYKELRHALTLELATLGENGSHREKDITPQDSLQEIVDKVTHKNIQSLLDTQRLLLLDELEQCVELIANARTVLLFGIGSSLCVAKDTYLKFLRLDKPCVVNEDSHSQLLQARNATAQDVGIVFSYSGQTMEMIQCIKEMKAGGAPVIAVTRYYPSEVAQLADHVLYVAANESLFRNGAMSSRLSQLNVVDILYTAYASRNHEDTMRRLAALEGSDFAGVVANNLAQFGYASPLPVFGGLGLNVTNPMSAAEYVCLGARGLLVQPETALTAMRAVAPRQKDGTPVPTAALCYGHLPLMLTRACPLRNVRTSCAGCTHKGKLRDRKGRDFPVRCSAPGSAGMRTVFNPVPLYMGDRLTEMPVDLAVAAFTLEPADRVEEVLTHLFHQQPFDGEFTRGLYYTNN